MLSLDERVLSHKTKIGNSNTGQFAQDPALSALSRTAKRQIGHDENSSNSRPLFSPGAIKVLCNKGLILSLQDAAAR
jgi:hypothetical protein